MFLRIKQGKEIMSQENKTVDGAEEDLRVAKQYMDNVIAEGADIKTINAAIESYLYAEAAVIKLNMNYNRLESKKRLEEISSRVNEKILQINEECNQERKEIRKDLKRKQRNIFIIAAIVVVGLIAAAIGFSE